MRNRIRNLGLTLIETITAIVITMLTVLGVTMIVTHTVRANLENQRHTEATQIAERLIEETLSTLQAGDLETLTCPGTTNGTEIGDSGTEYHTLLETTPLTLDLN